MRHAVRIPLVAAAVIVVLAPACTGTTSPAGTESQSTRAPAALTAPEASTTSDPSTPGADSPDEAADDAVAAMESYLQTTNQLTLDTGAALSELESIATGDALEWAGRTVSTARNRGWTITGERTFDEIDVTRVQLDPAESESGYPEVHLDACLDSTAVDARDEDGDSVLPSARHTRLTTHWTIWRVDGRWVVAKTGFIGETAEAEPCA